MQSNKRTKRTLTFSLALAVLLLVVASCTPVEEVAVVPTTAPGVTAPAAVTAAHEAALAYLRAGSNECVPQRGTPWQVEQQASPAGMDVYVFSGGNCRMIVSYTTDSTEDAIYHVSLHDKGSRFCWQANVSPGGSIVAVGSFAELGDAPNNPAAVYCKGQGHRFELRTLDDGTKCGSCVFADGSFCNGWLYLSGQCVPGDNPAGASGTQS